MAKARGSAPDPPAESEESGKEEASSEEEEVNGGSGSESDSESEPEESKQPDNSEPTKKPSSAPAPAPAMKKPETHKPPSPDTSSDEEDSGSDSESDSPETKPDPNIKPIASKPVETTASKEPKSKVNSSLLSSPTKTISTAGSKRPANSETGGDGEGKETKRLKKKPEKYVVESEKKGNSNDDSRKLFQRLWSEDDEIAILKGMADYSAKKKADPVANLDVFHEFIKKSLHIDVTRTQLQDKIRRLRKKYANNADKEKKGKERIFAKDHEQKAFELSKKVWGNENSTAGKKLESPKFNGEVSKRSQSKNVNTKKPQNEVQEVQEEGNKEGKILISENPGLEEGLKPVNMGLRNSGIEEWIMENSHFVDEEKRAKMDEKWKNFKMVEAEFYAKKLELMLEDTKLILDALKSSAS